MNKTSKYWYCWCWNSRNFKCPISAKKGFNVTIFDRDDPGSPAASYGNAGHFSPYASLSLNRTDVLADVPAMLLSSTGPLALKWNYVPKMLPWFFKFIFNTSQKNDAYSKKYASNFRFGITCLR